MTLTAKDVAEITKLLEESDFDELELELDGMRLSLRRGASADFAGERATSAGARGTVATAGAAATPAPAALTPPATASAGIAAATGVEPAGSSTAPGGEDARQHGVAAPLLGTFYRAPRPGAPPFVEVGSEVEPNTVIAIIEVMKLMNTVRAGVHGRVAQIVARDATLVEYGEALLRVSRIA